MAADQHDSTASHAGSSAGNGPAAPVTTARTYATLGGLAAILFWSGTVSVSRIQTEALGPLATGALVYLLAGVPSVAWLLARPRRRLALRTLRPRYLVGCGGLFVLYTVCLYTAIGLAAQREQVLEVGVINYLWPGLTLALSVPILRKRAGWALPIGVAAGFAGVVLATWPQGRLSWEAFGAALRRNAWPYVLALIAAVAWALYSNLARRWAGGARAGAVPLFILATGVVMAAMYAAVGGPVRWSATVLAALAFVAVFPTFLGYALWEAAMRRGHVTLVASAAYLTPLLSTGLSCAVLGVLPGVNLWIACALVVAGAVLCKASIRQ